jgi:hypothetical protein
MVLVEPANDPPNPVRIKSPRLPDAVKAYVPLITLKLQIPPAGAVPPRMEVAVAVLLFIVTVLLPLVVKFVPVAVSHTVPVPVVVMLPVDPNEIDLTVDPEELNDWQVSEFPFKFSVPPLRRYCPIVLTDELLKFNVPEFWVILGAVSENPFKLTVPPTTKVPLDIVIFVESVSDPLLQDMAQPKVVPDALIVLVPLVKLI